MLIRKFSVKFVHARQQISDLTVKENQKGQKNHVYPSEKSLNVDTWQQRPLAAEAGSATNGLVEFSRHLSVKKWNCTPRLFTSEKKGSSLEHDILCSL